ncbi:relaxase/mobilization nuclease domain-containing protein [Gordonibacter sp. Marseille-P4307]|uniref:relaxase/mobilization nuclease domain-containing protein n=1 Tax=Gordonibacter sp. Marseille-P4307 TaxID=2161815 RepID=UPI000F54AFAE|nr:relaxase/mobilization nuclease domain-containing protein [Gordonibacter sp. Marseille-P4307]
MPIVKAISGHTNCQKVKTYLEKRNRALARDFFNLSWDERDMEGYDETMKDAVEWADEMDATRARCGNDEPYEGRRARTYKHFIISPDPDDHIDLPALRELAGAWAMKFFGDYQVAIVYHDDNQNRIPHAHLIVSCTNLVTGNRLHTDNPFELNRALQDMARDRDLSGLSNVMEHDEGLSRLAAKDEPEKTARTIQPTYMSRPERELVDSGAYSWVADIRSRVSVAKGLARNESEFRSILDMLGVTVADNSPKATNRDWIYSLADDPKCKVTGGHLGYLYSRRSLENGFENKAAYHPDAASSRTILKAAKDAVVLNDLVELDRMAKALETCSRFGIRSIADCDARIGMVEKRIAAGNGSEAERKSLEALREARDFTAANGLLPRASSKPKGVKPKADGSHGNGKKRPAEKRKHNRRDPQRGNREKGER